MSRKHSKVRCGLLAAGALLAFGPSVAGAAPGDLDKTFSGDGRAAISAPDPDEQAILWDVAVDHRGRPVSIGWTDDDFGADSFVGSWFVARFTRSGKLDASFAGDGTVALQANQLGTPRAIAIDSEGLIYVGGTKGDGASQSFAVARFRPNGSPDATYGGHDGEPAGFALTDIDSWAAIMDLAIDSQDRLVAAGTYYVGDGSQFARIGVVRYTTSGDEDNAFDANGVQGSSFPSNGWEVEIDEQDRVIAAGHGQDAAYVQRYLATGADDPDFGVGGTTTISAPQLLEIELSGLTLLPDGGVALALSSYDPDEFYVNEFVQLDAEGEFDTAIGGGDGRVDLVSTGGPTAWQDMVRDSSGRFVLVGGNEFEPGFDVGLTAARYRPSAAVDPLFGENGFSLYPVTGGTAYFRRAVVDPVSQRVYAVADDNSNETGLIARIETAPRCDGKVPTIVGTPAGDTLDGTARSDVISGAGGDDKLFGLGGDDVICGENGDDKLVGGPGQDTLIGGLGKDTEVQ
jgi:uncharacterized delta-60 repeat protein